MAYPVFPGALRRTAEVRGIGVTGVSDPTPERPSFRCLPALPTRVVLCVEGRTMMCMWVGPAVAYRIRLWHFRCSLGR